MTTGSLGSTTLPVVRTRRELAQAHRAGHSVVIIDSPKLRRQVDSLPRRLLAEFAEYLAMVLPLTVAALLLDSAILRAMGAGVAVAYAVTLWVALIVDGPRRFRVRGWEHGLVHYLRALRGQTAGAALMAVAEAVARVLSAMLRPQRPPRDVPPPVPGFARINDVARCIAAPHGPTAAGVMLAAA